MQINHFSEAGRNHQQMMMLYRMGLIFPTNRKFDEAVRINLCRPLYRRDNSIYNPENRQFKRFRKYTIMSIIIQYTKNINITYYKPNMHRRSVALKYNVT